MSETGANEKRKSSDRRRRPTRFWDVFNLRGRRMENRRASERQQPYFVERYSWFTFTLILLLLFFTIIDGLITVYLFEAGVCEEVNPIMDYLLRQGHMSFFVVKYSLTASGLPLLLIFKNWKLFRTRLRVGHILPVFVVLYAVLIMYQSYLLKFS